ncbi:hypothetical protein ECL_02071 [Enterobacter cloacae subsp. cloacae ATCC 13047]|uniref:Uncharacterized protein n=1 Tax=Enterobacter cloacae subsp. cloacae (strain ATCC 13047 / DSM 30054 / NBRC 13535 / NCTC 10005 / WDCM 00083 / NCDC 279-56) TaxID=716541 RepID=A0A0H3CM35_ENTCC|nr:hypothetical protein ECL_02071 [Enterobacter cloacae subsp. cloacae ATCC 13047]
MPEALQKIHDLFPEKDRNFSVLIFDNSVDIFPICDVILKTHL